MEISALTSELPEDGIEFFDLVGRYDNACRAQTDERLPKLGTKAPACWEALGMVLALLDCAASCHWGCAKGDHLLEFLVGRCANNAYAGILLMRSGYYDQALLMARCLGEAANLLSLFTLDRDLIEKWKSLDEKERKKKFAPVQVRIALQKLAGTLVADEERYRLLSGYSVHTDPSSIPQAHNVQGRPMSVSCYQEQGLIMALNELAMPVAFIAVFASSLLTLPDTVRATLRDTARELVKVLGGIDVKTKGRPWFNLQ